MSAESNLDFLEGRALREGLTRTEVIKAHSSSDSFRRSGDYEAPNYVDREINGWLLTSPDIVCVQELKGACGESRLLYNSQKRLVIQYGQGRVIERGSAEPPFMLAMMMRPDKRRIHRN
ncbi:MAG TPA: hypothetical protein VFI43_03725 [Nitrosospira sp.]|nr:hypothetical protein [Nitrosospira sp.]